MRNRALHSYKRLPRLRSIWLDRAPGGNCRYFLQCRRVVLQYHQPLLLLGRRDGLERDRFLHFSLPLRGLPQRVSFGMVLLQVFSFVVLGFAAGM